MSPGAFFLLFLTYQHLKVLNVLTEELLFYNLEIFGLKTWIAIFLASIHPICNGF